MTERGATDMDPMRHHVTTACRAVMCELAEALAALSRTFDPARSTGPLGNDLDDVRRHLDRALAGVAEARDAID